MVLALTKMRSRLAEVFTHRSEERKVQRAQRELISSLLTQAANPGTGLPTLTDDKFNNYTFGIRGSLTADLYKEADASHQVGLLHYQSPLCNTRKNSEPFPPFELNETELRNFYLKSPEGILILESPFLLPKKVFFSPNQSPLISGEFKSFGFDNSGCVDVLITAIAMMDEIIKARGNTPPTSFGKIQIHWRPKTESDSAQAFEINDSKLNLRMATILKERFQSLLDRTSAELARKRALALQKPEAAPESTPSVRTLDQIDLLKTRPQNS